MSSFMEEYLGARFNHKRKKIHKEQKYKKSSYDMNNARNRDIYSVAKATGRIADWDADKAYEYWEDNYIDENYEDRLIDEIDESIIESQSHKEEQGDPQDH